jgi:hypothetical protein
MDRERIRWIVLEALSCPRSAQISRVVNTTMVKAFNSVYIPIYLEMRLDQPWRYDQGVVPKYRDLFCWEAFVLGTPVPQEPQIEAVHNKLQQRAPNPKGEEQCDVFPTERLQEEHDRLPANIAFLNFLGQNQLPACLLLRLLFRRGIDSCFVYLDSFLCFSSAWRAGSEARIADKS